MFALYSKRGFYGGEMIACQFAIISRITHNVLNDPYYIYLMYSSIELTLAARGSTGRQNLTSAYVRF